MAGNTVAGDLVSVNYEYRDALCPKMSPLLPRVRGRAETSQQGSSSLVLWFWFLPPAAAIPRVALLSRGCLSAA